MLRYSVMIFAAAIPLAAIPQGEARAQTAQAAQKDIIVEGWRKKKDDISKNIAPVPSIVGFKVLASKSTTFARCVRNPDLEQLHAMIDGMPNSTPAKFALDRLIRSNAACYASYILPSPNPPFFGDCNPQPVEDLVDLRTPVLTMCAAFYDRGALMGAAIARYVPDFSLTLEEVNNRVVQERLAARETPRNRFRLPEDQRYFRIALCMVKRQPELATWLVQADGDAGLQQKIGQLILLRSKGCIGDVRRVKVEPAQFSIYITDAAYRWEVAARGIDSLLPVAG